MKRNLNMVVLTATFALMTSPVSAEFTGGSSSASVTSVAEFKSQCDLKTGGGDGLLSGALSAAAEGAKCDDKKFTIQGQIIAQIKDNLYEFKDSTGTVSVEIDDFHGVKVGPKDLVRLRGDADYEETGLVLEIDQLELVDLRKLREQK